MNYVEQNPDSPIFLSCKDSIFTDADYQAMTDRENKNPLYELDKDTQKIPPPVFSNFVPKPLNNIKVKICNKKFRRKTI